MAADHTGHDVAHVNRVVSLARQLLQTEPANEEQTLVIAYLHDVGDEKLTETPARKRREVSAKLREWGYPPALVTKIMADIDHLSFAKNLEHSYHLDRAGQIAQDADRLDALGPIAIARTFAYGAIHDLPMYAPENDPAVLNTKQAYRQARDTFHHYQVRAERVVDQLNTPTARRLAAPRMAVTRRFLARFSAEWQGDA
ncbi:HD domain-containing protein [Fructilactobacillus myrtifloralis]|uniref:HD domain-containing protein n=1 Tax=Fructilactobacillus myrtifloralis TaxID=2940301 RepID=A0ABY5BLI3_9LACO|nr:HD domain-containing protein [Fructilactobacillus myrtifloralis]USS84522.1 HD domain-containing protein [Fructilactobacillus myrtifloralis]